MAELAAHATVSAAIPPEVTIQKHCVCKGAWTLKFGYLSCLRAPRVARELRSNPWRSCIQPHKYAIVYTAEITNERMSFAWIGTFSFVFLHRKSIFGEAGQPWAQKYCRSTPCWICFCPSLFSDFQSINDRMWNRVYFVKREIYRS